MKKTRGAKRLLSTLAVLMLLALPSLALAGPRSGGSFGGRLGFRSGGGSSMPRSYSSPGYSGGGSHYIFAPGWGWGWGGGYGYGGGLGLFGTLVVIAVVGYGAFAISRAIRRARQGGAAGWQDGYQSGYGDSYDDEAQVAAGRAYVYKLQLGLGRSARGIQQRLEQFATSGDTSTEAGLAALLQQSALELLRQKDSIRYAGADASGPMSLTNAETKMNGLALTERSRFEVERVRSADGRVNRAQESAIEGAEALEVVVVTMIVATRTPLSAFKTIGSHQELEAILSELGGVAPGGLLGLEVVWTPADPDDSMTETDLMTTYPELRSL